MGRGRKQRQIALVWTGRTGTICLVGSGARLKKAITTLQVLIPKDLTRNQTRYKLVTEPLKKERISALDFKD